MKKDVSPRVRSAIIPPGTGRLGVVSAYFQLAGVAGAIGVVVITSSLFVSGFPVRTTPSSAAVSLFGAVLMTVGFFRTSRLLDQRRKAGAHLAALCFIGPLVGYLTGSAPSLGTLIVAGAGLALVASVWRHLD